MTPEDLLYQSGHTRDSIDDFYAELKGEESAGRLTVHHPDDTDLRITLAAG